MYSIILSYYIPGIKKTTEDTLLAVLKKNEINEKNLFYRYRNFRTFASPRPVQFSSIGLDPSGDVVVAGSQDTFEIFVWSMQTGRLLEVCQHGMHSA